MAFVAVNAEHLRQLAPPQSGRRAERQHEIIEGMGISFATTVEKYDINTPLRIAHFLAQVAHESDGFCTTEEYASGRAYENRKDLGNTHEGDGPLFKGRGLLQLTGRANYRAVGEKIDEALEARPLLVNDPATYLLVSCVFWADKKINPHCDADDIISVTHIVNGGLNGLPSRKAYLLKAKSLIASIAAGSVEPPGEGVPVLHRGIEGSSVVDLQRQLVSAGYKIALDGDFGAGTELAVKHFQAAFGLDPDGIVGAQTWAKLKVAPKKT